MESIVFDTSKIENINMKVRRVVPAPFKMIVDDGNSHFLHNYLSKLIGKGNPSPRQRCCE